VSFVDDFVAKQEGAAQGARALKAGSGGDSFLGGFLSSAFSSVPEMFGQNPTDAATTFRTAHPIAGVASELLPTFGTYGAVAKGMEAIPFAARGLESVMAATKLDAVASPIAYGAVKEMARFAPFEIARLGIGLATAPSENYGKLFADVGLSELLAGGFGGIGGYFRTGGKTEPSLGRVVGSDLALKPTFELRMGLDDAAQVTGDVPLDEVKQQLVRRVLNETPSESTVKGFAARYVDKLENGDPESDSFINSLFRAKGSENKLGLLKQKLIEGAPQSKNTLNDGELQTVLSAAGFDSITDLASTAVFPRLLTINNERMAGQISKSLTGGAGIQQVGDGVLMAREANDGLFVVAKRVRSGATDGVEMSAENGVKSPDLGAATAPTEAAGTKVPPKTFGPHKIANGDQWLIFKTDKPQRFAPDAAKVAQLNFNQFAKYESSFKTGQAADPFNMEADAVLESVTPNDFRDLTKVGKQTWLSNMSQKLARSVGDMTGLKDSQTLKATGDWLWSTAAPRAFKQNKNSLYARLGMMLDVNMKVAEGLTSRIMGGAVKFGGTSPLKALMGGMHYESAFEGFEPARDILTRMHGRGEGEWKVVTDAMRTQTPAEDLAKLAPDGLISKEMQADYEQLQKINETYINNVTLPALETAGLGGQFEPLKGYVLPRVFRGDFHVSVRDAAGREQFLATGVNGAAAKREADAIIAEAAERGQTWAKGDAIMHGSEYEKGALDEISDMVSKQMAKSGDSQEIIQTALRKLNSAQKARAGGAMRPGKSLATFNERSGRKGTPDREVLELKQAVKDMEQHYGQLGRFAAYHTWNQRWSPIALNLSKQDPTLYGDLMREAQLYMGIPGPLTKVLNNTLRPVLGHVLGANSATKIAQFTNNAMYAWNIGIANPTFAILNVLQPLQTVTPLLAFAMNGPSERVAQYFQFLPKYGADGLPRGVGGFLHPMKIMGQAMRMGRKPEPDELAALQRSLTDGVLNAQVHEDWIGAGSKAARTLADSYKAGGPWELIKHASTYMAEKSETLSRMIAFNSFYLLGRDHFGMNGDQLYNFAKRGTTMSMYSYGVVDRSKMFTGPVGSMFGLFKNWQFHFIGQMGQYAGMALKGEAYAPLIWQGASALALGGIGATPLKMAADGLAKWNSDSPDSYTWMKEHWHNAADEIYFGLPALLGVSLQASSTMPGTDVRNDLSSLSNFVFLERAKAAGKAVGNAWSLGTTTDENALRDPNVRDQLLAAFAPRAVFKAFSAVEGNYVKSMATGYPQERNVSAASRIFTALGFNTPEIEAQQQASNKLYMDQEGTRTAVTQMGKAYANAQLNQDWDGMERVIQRTVGLHLPVSSVMKSAQTVIHREQSGDSFSRYKGEKAAQFMSALQD
jgi:hypothetical protein